MGDGEQEQIASLKQAIEDIDANIAQRTAMLSQAATPEERRAIQASIASLQAERARLEAQLNDLEAADVEVKPLGDGSSGPADGDK
jgi:predicted  nucleic acid-binding Zn-ribbon protein